jgi:hypothetical protein
MSVPIPDLRIVPTGSLFPHEEHDSQRSIPLAERLRTEEFVINPPVVAPIDSEDRFVILDGANRCHAFLELGYPHIIVQVASYESGLVDLLTWNHVISAWQTDIFLQEIEHLNPVQISEDATPPLRIVLHDGQSLALQLPVSKLQEKNAMLCDFVRIYQQHARLNRTAIREPQNIWDLYPDAIALVNFPSFTPADIMSAARHHAYLPPGVSRHIIHGRALRVNYPMKHMRDPHVSLVDKNHELREWFQRKLANRQIRFYAESTYQFDE